MPQRLRQLSKSFLENSRTVVVEFPDYNTAIECYDSKEYQDAHEVLDGYVVRHHQIVEAS